MTLSKAAEENVAMSTELKTLRASSSEKDAKLATVLNQFSELRDKAGAMRHEMAAKIQTEKDKVRGRRRVV
jgi:hypothetical protein